jgi:hypothetical protein
MQKIIYTFIFLIYITNVFAWNDHAFTTYFILENSNKHKLNSLVKVESLQSFLLDLKKNNPKSIENSILNSENWALKNMPGYHPIPENIFYREENTNSENIVKSFLKGIRVNPNSNVLPYVRNLPNTQFNQYFKLEKEIKNRKQIIIPELENTLLDNLRYYKILENENVPALLVLTTAVDEPDLGFDINLFENNQSDFGKVYGFGEQPFGDYRVPFASAAPFHYGAYHEMKLMYKIAPQSQECYAEYRIKLYRDLARLAFKTGHNYWGWRFLGFGLHYIQDLAQPYHSQYFPAVNTFKIIGFYALSLLHYSTPLKNAISIVANNHFLIEDFVIKYLQRTNNSVSLKIKEALNTQNYSADNLEYNDKYPRDIITKNASLFSEQLAQSVQNTFPSYYSNNPDYLYDDKKENIVQIFENVPKEKQNLWLNTINSVLEKTGYYTRIYLNEFN